jgi:hypothetical protein
MSSKLAAVNFDELHPPTRIIRVADDMARILKKPNSTGWHCQETKATSSLAICHLM